MKKHPLFLTIFVLGLVTLSGCATQPKEVTPETATTETVVAVEETATIIIQEDGKEIAKKSISFEAGTVLFDLMTANFEIENQDGFITSIDGIGEDEAAGKYWMYDINGEMGLKGATELEIKTGDEVLFKLEEMK